MAFANRNRANRACTCLPFARESVERLGDASVYILSTLTIVISSMSMGTVMDMGTVVAIQTPMHDLGFFFAKLAEPAICCRNCVSSGLPRPG